MFREGTGKLVGVLLQSTTVEVPLTPNLLCALVSLTTVLPTSVFQQRTLAVG
jgi:hypothetical protein